MVLREGDAAVDRYTSFSVESRTTATTPGSKSKDESDGGNIRQWTQDTDFRETAAVWPLSERGRLNWEPLRAAGK